MLERVYFNFDWDFNGELVNIPHTVCEIPYNYVNENDYQMISEYKKDIFIDNNYLGKNLFLTFEGVAHKSEVYINNKLVITNNCGYNTFKVNIKDYVNYNENNNIKVIVNSKEDLNIPPFGNVIDYLTYGGIYRDVYLDIFDDVYVDNLFIKPIYKDSKWSIDLDIKLNKLSNYKIEILDSNNVIINKEITPNNIHEIINISFDNPKLWDIDNPYLYKIRIIIGEDISEYEFGLRKVEFKKDGFYLNNKKVKILGLNRHQAYPYVGYAMPRSMQELDAKILKNELHVNAVRTSHYMQSHHFISMCDKLGLLVFTEAPGWQYLGDDSWKNIHLDNVKNMIIEYRNHPSIIMWGVRINESVDCHDLYKKCNDLAHLLDDTRPTGGVRCYANGEELEDVYTYNDFCDPNMERGLSLKKNICSKGIPYLVSEFNGHMYPTKMFDKEVLRVNQALRICKGMNEFYGDDEITGFFVWCMADYNTHKDFGSGDRICYHGVLDMFRNPKIASYIYSSQDSKPYFNLSSHLNIGDYDASTIDKIYAFTNADIVKLYRNGELIKVYDNSNRVYKNIPNSPILIDDFVGNLLEVKEGYSKKASDMMKSVLYATLKYGNKMPFKYKWMYLKLMLFNHVNYQKGYELYGKYIGNWGSKEIVYTFDAIKDDKLFKTVNLSKVTDKHLDINVSNNELIEDNSYDVSLVRIRALDQNDNILEYYNDGFTVSSEGVIEIIGPTVLSFKGGYSGVYVKSTSKKGKGVLNINTNIGKISVDFTVK